MVYRKGGAGLQRDNNLAVKIQREWTLQAVSAKTFEPNISAISQRIFMKFKIQIF
jgi:hypothetical protein